jgi:hypothetical protein
MNPDLTPRLLFHFAVCIQYFALFGTESLNPNRDHRSAFAGSSAGGSISGVPKTGAVLLFSALAGSAGALRPTPYPIENGGAAGHLKETRT